MSAAIRGREVFAIASPIDGPPGASEPTRYHVEADTLPQFTLLQLPTSTADTSWTDSLSVTTMPLRVYRLKAVTP